MSGKMKDIAIEFKGVQLSGHTHNFTEEDRQLGIKRYEAAARWNDFGSARAFQMAEKEKNNERRDEHYKNCARHAQNAKLARFKAFMLHSMPLRMINLGAIHPMAISHGKPREAMLSQVRQTPDNATA